jgi:lipoprotein-releasing system permease protein
MNNYLPFFIGFRYIFSKRREGFVSFVSIVSMLAMSLGVMTLITVLSVMNGFDYEIKQRVLKVIPHTTINTKSGFADWHLLSDDISKVPNVEAVTPYIESQAMLTHFGRLQGVNVIGILPGQELLTDSIGRQISAGQLNHLQAGQYNIVLGKLLAQALDAVVGDRVLLTMPEVFVTPAGVYPRVKKFEVVAIFETGAQVDSGIAMVHMDDARKLLRLGEKITGLRLFLSNPFNLNDITQIKYLVPSGTQITTWQESMSELFTAIRMEKTVVGLLLSVIIGIAAFNIVASLVLMVSDKRTDIAVLRTMGSTAKDISRIFQIQGGLTGLVGVLLGVVMGCALALTVGELLIWMEGTFGFEVFDPGLYFITRLPSQLQWPDVLIVASLGLILSVLATWYPARRASQVPPVDALRYK